MKLIKTERKISWDIYLAAFVVSAIIFGAGLWIGLQIEKSVSERLTGDIENTKQKIVSLETMLLFNESGEFCPFFTEEMEIFDKETADVGNKIGYMEEHRGSDPQLKSDYMLLELRDYLLIRKIDSVCGTKTNVVLYFLNSQSCADCTRQGEELTAARVGASISIRVYSFDVSINNTAVALLGKSLNVSVMPTLIINGKPYEGLTSRAVVLSALG